MYFYSAHTNLTPLLSFYESFSTKTYITNNVPFESLYHIYHVLYYCYSPPIFHHFIVIKKTSTFVNFAVC
nr:MAG TPA: hypothetical protein [Caudoviricetes sp.]